MAEINRVALFGKLNTLAYRSVESATLFCKMRGNPYVELAHWAHQLMELPNTDLHRIFHHFDVDLGRLSRDLTEALDRLPRGATSVSDLSVHVEESVERGWVYASLLFNQSRVRTGHLLVGILKTPSLRNALQGVSREFIKVKVEALTDGFSKITGGSPEADMEAAAPPSQGSTGGPEERPVAPAAMGKQEALERYSVDLTERARKGEMDPILGRDDEIRQIVHVLLRRRQNNPILTGEAGVGKTAVVEGFAQRIARGDVPPALEHVTLRALDIGLLQAGASMKGEFEARLRQVIDEVQASSKPIILFIDEAHTLIGAGGAAGTGDAANLLKPALARGKLRTIAATTWAEYKKHIEPDPALTRRFQLVQVAEPSEEKAILMMRGVAAQLRAHHQVELLDEAVEAAVKLSARYIPDRQLPDKAVSLLDTACARVAMTQHGVPSDVENSRRRIDSLRAEIEVVDREEAIGVGVGSRREDASVALGEETRALEGREARWNSEKALVTRILALQTELTAPPEPAADGASSSLPETPPPAEKRSALVTELNGLRTELAQLQGETPLVVPTVDAQAVAAVVSEWTGIPTGRMVKNEIETVLNLANLLGRRIVGQGPALELIANRIQAARAHLENPSKPIGVFLLAGPSGVGKTETALGLAEALYGGERNVITINMSEFQEAHTVSTLKGAPPGYVGYGEGGVLTEAVRRRPYSVVLLDEVEKAHPDVHEVFFQVFDKGFMEDGAGTYVDFKNTIILLTSNVGSEVLTTMTRAKPDADMATLAQALRPALLDAFPAALLGRMTVVPYRGLSDETMDSIIRLQLGRIRDRVQKNYGVPFVYDAAVVDHVRSRCNEVESGGRVIDAVLTNTLLPHIGRELLVRMLDGKTLTSVSVTARDGDFVYAFD